MKKKFLVWFAVATIIPCGAYTQENTIPSTGNVGIGTTVPQVRLDVKGRVQIDSTLMVKDSVTIQKNLRVEEDVRFLGQTKLNNTKVLTDFTVQGLSKMNGDVKMTALESVANLNNKYIVLSNENGLLKKVSFDTILKITRPSLGTSGAVDLVGFCGLVDINGNTYSANPYWISGPNKLVVPCPNVNVGIGTGSPRVKLDVNGTAYTKKIAINANPLTMGNKLFHLKANYTHPSQSDRILFLVENHERALFQISNNGIVRSREIIVNLDQAWPDYVFKPDYKLTPLSEVASFIKTNGHLPNVPNAEVIEKEGVSLGEMNRILLEKVEELTLHLIEQQKLIEQQGERIEVLESQNK